MDKNNLQSLFTNAEKNGGTLGKGTGYFEATDGLPTSGTDTILAAVIDPADESKNTIRVSTSQNSSNIVVSYKTRGGRWLSKNTLFGRHYCPSANAAARIPEMLCRTEFAKPADHELMEVMVQGKTIKVYVFTKDTPITYGKKTSKVYLPVQQDAWNGKTMNVTREVSDYATLTVG